MIVNSSVFHFTRNVHVDKTLLRKLSASFKSWQMSCCILHLCSPADHGMKDFYHLQLLSLLLILIHMMCARKDGQLLYSYGQTSMLGFFWHFWIKHSCGCCCPQRVVSILTPNSSPTKYLNSKYLQCIKSNTLLCIPGFIGYRGNLF